jgi:hypothetical protein
MREPGLPKRPVYFKKSKVKEKALLGSTIYQNLMSEQLFQMMNFEC